MPYNSGAVATERSSVVSYNRMPVPTTSRYSSTSSSAYRSSVSDRPYYSSATSTYTSATRSTLPRSPITSEYRHNYSATTSRSAPTSHTRTSSLSDDSSKRSVTSRERSETREPSFPSSASSASLTRSSAKSRFSDTAPVVTAGLSRRISSLDSDFYSKYSPSNYVPNSVTSERPPLKPTPSCDDKASGSVRSRGTKNATVEVSRTSRAVGGCSTLERRLRQSSLDECRNNNVADDNASDANGNERRLSVAEIRRRFDIAKDLAAEKTARPAETNGKETKPNRDETAEGSPSRKVFTSGNVSSSSEEEDEEASESDKNEASSKDAKRVSSPARSLRRSVPVANIAGGSPKSGARLSNSAGPSWTASDDSDDASSSSRRSKKAAENNGLTGLVNIGNTCFMNSVIQCLSNTKPLLEYLLSETYTTDLNHNSGMKGKLISAFSEMVKELWSSSGSVASPVAFKAQISKYAPRFMGYSQQDAQEFLRFLLEGVHEDVNRVKNRPRQLSDVKDSPNTSPEQKAVEQWKRYLRQDDSKIVDLFVGQLRSTLRCSSCGHCSVTFDPFWDLQLPIPAARGAAQLRLQQCLDHFTTEEVLDGNEKAYCAKCEKNQKSTKSFTIQKFPKILVLQLNRFSPSDRYRRKLSVTVDFPLDHLDLGAYASVRGASDCVYSLYGVSNHSGSPSFGHYTAYCRHPHSGQWHEYNDSRVSSISTRSVVSNEAYLLFYELSSRSSHL